LIRDRLDSVEQQVGNFSAFELEFNALVRKHFPHWDAKDLSQLLKS
jgi:sulfate adenylyltransferase subunit 1